MNGVITYEDPILGRSYTLFERVKILRAAARLIGKPGKFAEGTLARTADGAPCSPLSPKAECFCGLGAVVRATSTLGLLPKNFSDNDDRGDFQVCYDLANGIVGGLTKGDEIVRTNDSGDLKAPRLVSDMLERFASFFVAKKPAA